MYERFVASLPVEIPVVEQPIPIRHYLRQPQRLVYALIDPTRLQRLGDDRYRLNMRPLNFLHLSVQPTVDLRVWADADGTVHLRSLGCDIRGIDYINERFSLNLFGRLVPRDRDGITYLHGIADLEVKVEMPPALWFTPKPMLQGAGNTLLKSVLATIDSRLRQQLLADYYRWAGAERQQNRTSRDLPGNLNGVVGLSPQ